MIGATVDEVVAVAGAPPALGDGMPGRPAAFADKLTNYSTSTDLQRRIPAMEE